MKRLIATLLFITTMLIALAGHPVYAQDSASPDDYGCKTDFALVDSNCN